MIDTAIYIGRFQPFHIGHLENCIQALDQAKKLIILVGSSGIGAIPNNPWSFENRQQMILSALPDMVHSRVEILPLYDSLYDQVAWETRVKTLVDTHTLTTDTKALVVFAKDESSFYLDCFPAWQQINLPMVVDHNNECISATNIRHAFYNAYEIPDQIVMPVVKKIMLTNMSDDKLTMLKKAYETLTSDQIEKKTMFLLVLRYQKKVLVCMRDEPLGYDQWALPAFDNQIKLEQFLAKHDLDLALGTTSLIHSSMLKLSCQVTYIESLQPLNLDNGLKLFSKSMIMNNDIFADHRSILYEPMTLNF